ncbi:uncharacterized protein LOC111892825 [Lactuca sativa]|uniref:uncharacterized protein LOC111892825 n=1 Tax=Lactuca sativa TaxID=4236 RepID=UPI000CD9D350|nr:uncharacterized protein LOC111892825 [Lactuca sativa]XP_023744651.1 uncharacterized protein LOC111892825 [Lactuca sativa]
MDKDMEDVDKRYEWLHSEHSSSSAAGEIFGEPQRTARIGDEYQAQIPFLMTEKEQLTTCQHAQNKFRFGLSIPVIWIHVQHAKGGGKGKSGTNCLVPGSSSESWSMMEHDSFLLGLYIFGKNLGLVNKFMGNKGMRNVVSYYYGKFYRSGEHQKWSKFRKKRSRKSVPGKKIFKGWRRHELLSRLLPNVTDECKTSLTQVTRMYEEEKISFDKYVLTVRDAVGINLLVEAIAIGKGKRDLSGRAKKSMKNKKLNSSSAIACSSLEPQEIVNLLKDGIGLSKERLNEIFWEVVWPRLLARGWHSEQHRNYAFQNSHNHNNQNHSLVFLAPGVTKFSRRSLEKGSQYFDSFNELLNKVASEPWILEQVPDNDQEHSDEDKQKDLMKCTIVDTSLAGVVKVSEVTSLHVPQQSSSGESEQETTEESQEENANHGVVDSQDCETSGVDHLEEGKPVRKLKLICKVPKPRKHNTSNNDKLLSCEDEAMEEDPGCKKKGGGIVIDLNRPRVGPDSDGDNSVLHECETATNQAKLNGGQRQSRRNRPLSMKALEALANGFLNPKKKRRGTGTEETRGRCVRAKSKTALVSSCGARYIENSSRVEGVFSVVSESPK